MEKLASTKIKLATNIKLLVATLALVGSVGLAFILTSVSSAKPRKSIANTTAMYIAPSAIPWGYVVYDGYGTVKWDSKFLSLSLSPKAATQPSETHSALVVSNGSFQQPYEASFSLKTTKQLRSGSAPNPWEVGWFVFGYKDTGKFKYLILKPNGYGVELGESLLNDQQNFLYTSPINQDNFSINTTYNIVLRAQDNVITVTVNGKQYAQYTMSPKDQLTADGQYGFYTEDASVVVSNIAVKQL